MSTPHDARFIIDVNVINSGRTTIATADVINSEGIIIFSESATAHCHPNDKTNMDIAVNYAGARVLRNVSKRLERQAAGSVKHIDDMRARSFNVKKNDENFKQIVNKFDVIHSDEEKLREL
jgi:hypothetical protein